MQARNQYLNVLVERYLKADKKGKGRLLDEYCTNTGQNRKYAIRKLKRAAFGEPRERKRRTRQYGSDVRMPLARIWRIFDRPCGQRLRPLLTSELARLRTLGAIRIAPGVEAKLRTISPATIDRLLRPMKGKVKTRRDQHLLYKRIPLRMTEWDLTTVGCLEMDLVLHCGASTEGEYVSSLSMVEVGSGWWEGEAILGRGQLRVFDALTSIRDRTPFVWKDIDSDNDSMFINNHLARYCMHEGLSFTRSRPYRKNDNAYIEQKNYTHVRKPLGYLRYDTEEERALINDLYRHELRLYKNFFQPVMKLIKKERIEGKLKRTYDQPKTPYQRLIESHQLSASLTQMLHQEYRRLNPVALKEAIDEKLHHLYDCYHKKRKGLLRVNPYKGAGSSVTFSMMHQA